MVSTLYVGNLPWATTEDDLVEIFSAHGEVVSARIITDRVTGRSRGFGFVEVNDDDAAKMVDAMNGAEMENRQLTVNEAKPREER
ncbi:MAG: RNA recognition motif domain-containing protein [Bacillota bacterium]